LVSITPAPFAAIQIDITGDSTGYVAGVIPNDAKGDLDATVTLPSPGWTPFLTTWQISNDPGIGTATINASTGEWVYVVDPAEFDALDNGEIVSDVFEVTATAYAFNPGGNLQFETDTQLVTISIEGVCFVLGTLIETVLGPVPVEKLKAGDLVKTADHGPQPIRWLEGNEISPSRMKMNPSLFPVRIKAGALGQDLPHRDLYVSQQHRILVSGPSVQLNFAVTEVLVAAKSLCGWPGIDIVETDHTVGYFHILLDNHEILEAEGAPAESLYLGDEAMVSMSSDGLQELAEIFGGAEFDLPEGITHTARSLVRDYEAKLLTPA
jgi:VCBS repeat-containing protein